MLKEYGLHSKLFNLFQKESFRTRRFGNLAKLLSIKPGIAIAFI